MLVILLHAKASNHAACKSWGSPTKSYPTHPCRPPEGLVQAGFRVQLVAVSTPEEAAQNLTDTPFHQLT